VDNTNLKAWEAQPYVTVAKQHGYLVDIVTLPEMDVKLLAERNKHGLGVDDIQAMAGKMEEFTATEALRAVPPVTYMLSVKDQNKVRESLMRKEEVEEVATSSALR
jgi:hypothetical protein